MVFEYNCLNLIMIMVIEKPYWLKSERSIDIFKDNGQLKLYAFFPF